eukprot:12923635-Prorocentrum_lima.AAC.1
METTGGPPPDLRATSHDLRDEKVTPLVALGTGCSMVTPTISRGGTGMTAPSTTAGAGRAGAARDAAGAATDGDPSGGAAGPVGTAAGGELGAAADGAGATNPVDAPEPGLRLQGPARPPGLPRLPMSPWPRSGGGAVPTARSGGGGPGWGAAGPGGLSGCGRGRAWREVAGRAAGA